MGAVLLGILKGLGRRGGSYRRRGSSYRRRVCSYGLVGRRVSS